MTRETLDHIIWMEPRYILACPTCGTIRLSKKLAFLTGHSRNLAAQLKLTFIFAQNI